MLHKPESKFIYTNRIQRKIMLKPTFVAFCQFHKQVCCLYSSAKSVHNSRNKTQLYTYLAMLGATFIGCRVWQVMHRKNQLYTQIGKDARYNLHQLQSSSRSVHNSRKTSYTLIRLAKACLQASTYCDSIHNSRKKQQQPIHLAYESRPSWVFTYRDSHNSRKNQLYALTQLTEQAFWFSVFTYQYCDSYAT